MNLNVLTLTDQHFWLSHITIIWEMNVLEQSQDNSYRYYSSSVPSYDRYEQLGISWEKRPKKNWLNEWKMTFSTYLSLDNSKPLAQTTQMSNSATWEPVAVNEAGILQQELIQKVSILSNTDPAWEAPEASGFADVVSPVSLGKWQHRA